VEDEGVREGCDRLVQVLMRDEGEEVDGKMPEGGFLDAKEEEARVKEVDSDDEVVEVF